MRWSICLSRCQRRWPASRWPLYRQRLAGQYLEPLGIKVAYTPLGIVVALTFITLPFVVRTLQPVIEDIETEVEEAAASLGASRWQTFVK
jgi:ABC-type sulfate transport system permease component